MRFVMSFTLVTALALAACGKKTPEPAPVDAAPAADTAPAAAADTAPAAAADTAPAAAADTAPAADTGAAAGDAGAAADTGAAAGDAGVVADAGAAVGDAGAAADAGAAVGDAGAAVGDAGAAPTAKFDDLSKEEKKKFMKEVFMPPMREAFQTFDPKDFEKFTCATCHGPGAKEGRFEMPNPDIERLPQTQEGFQELAKKHPKELAFMKDTVTPLAAKLIGEALFDPATGKGFGCFECHMAVGQ